MVKNNYNYLIYLVITITFFTIGWAGNYYFTSFEDNAIEKEVTTQEELEKEEEPSKDIAELEIFTEYLFGIVENITIEGEKNSFDANLDLLASFEKVPLTKRNVLRKFELVEGVAKVYELKGRSILEENIQKSSFGSISEGDEVAIKTTLPLSVLGDVLDYDIFSVRELLIVREDE